MQGGGESRGALLYRVKASFLLLRSGALRPALFNPMLVCGKWTVVRRFVTECKKQIRRVCKTTTKKVSAKKKMASVLFFSSCEVYFSLCSQSLNKNIRPHYGCSENREKENEKKNQKSDRDGLLYWTPITTTGARGAVSKRRKEKKGNKKVFGVTPSLHLFPTLLLWENVRKKRIITLF